MADDKRGREKKTADAERRQRTRDIATELEHGDDPEPPVDPEELADIDSELESLSFPATGAEIVGTVGDREVRSATGSYTLEELIPDTDSERFDSPRAVHVRIQRPTVAATIKRVVEASHGLPNADRFGSQREAYTKTFHELTVIDADDDDEVVLAIGDWIVEQIRENDELPSSRAVRRQAAKICRANGYRVRDSDWLGI
jgi:hypothetical protein